jgi:hypothetical protein
MIGSFEQLSHTPDEYGECATVPHKDLKHPEGCVDHIVSIVSLRLRISKILMTKKVQTRGNEGV